MTTELETIERQTGADPGHAVIWLHGLGADGHDFEPIVPQLGLPADLPLRFIFPHAPVRPVTVNNGMAMRAWYDIADLPPDRGGGVAREDRQGMRDSVAAVRRLIERENARGIAGQCIVLAGFSQGGAIALLTLMEMDFAGVIALSTWLPGHARASAGGRATPVFMGHGADDPMVPVELGRRGADTLSAMGYSVTFKTYPAPHSVHPLEIHEVGQFIGSAFGR